jgi:hypothetical protein
MLVAVDVLLGDNGIVAGGFSFTGAGSADVGVVALPLLLLIEKLSAG